MTPFTRALRRPQHLCPCLGTGNCMLQPQGPCQLCRIASHLCLPHTIATSWRLLRPQPREGGLVSAPALDRGHGLKGCHARRQPHWTLKGPLQWLLGLEPSAFLALASCHWHTEWKNLPGPQQAGRLQIWIRPGSAMCRVHRTPKAHWNPKVEGDSSLTDSDSGLAYCRLLSYQMSQGKKNFIGAESPAGTTSSGHGDHKTLADVTVICHMGPPPHSFG